MDHACRAVELLAPGGSMDAIRAAVNAGAKQLLFQRDVSFVMKVVFSMSKGEITMVMAVTDRRMMLKYYYILESFTSSLNSILY